MLMSLIDTLLSHADNGVESVSLQAPGTVSKIRGGIIISLPLYQQTFNGVMCKSF